MEYLGNQDNWELQAADYKQILDQLKSDDIMFVYEGVSQLKQSLALENEQSLAGFPLEAYIAKLTELVGQEPIMDISNEIKFSALSCLLLLMDSFPTISGSIVHHGIVKALCQTMEQSMGFIELSESCIKAFERISTENPTAVLRSQALGACLNMMDFFDNTTQGRILQLFLNLSNPSSDTDFLEFLSPHLGNLCQKVHICYESDQAKVEKISTILLNITSSFTKVINPIDSFERIAALYDKVAELGVVEAIVSCLETFKNYVQAMQKQETQTTQVDTKATSSKSYSEVTIQNFLSILQLCSIYSQQTVMVLVSGGIFQTCEVLLPAISGDQDFQNCTEEVLSLLNALCPSSSEGKREVVLGLKQTIYAQTVAGDPDKRFETFLLAQKNVEDQKKSFLQAQSPHFQSFMAQSLLPKLIGLFSLPNSSSSVRVKCLQILEKLVDVILSEQLATSVDPQSFAQFVHKIFDSTDSKNGQQVLATLRIAQKILTRNPILFVIPFNREGIKQYVQDFSEQAKRFAESDRVQENKPQRPGEDFLKLIMGGTSSLSGEAANLEIGKLRKQREKIEAKIQEVNAEVKECKTPTDHMVNKHKAIVLERELIRYSKAIDRLEQIVSQFKTEEVKDEETQPVAETKEQLPKVLLVSEQIVELSTKLLQEFFNNNQFEQQVALQFPQEVKVLPDLKQLASDLQALAVTEVFDFQKTKNVLQLLAEKLTNSFGITSYEFEKSGLLRSLELFLTKSVSQAQVSVDQDSVEEKKNSQEIAMSSAYKKASKPVSVKEAKTFILRLKTFTHVMATQKNGQLPFKVLISQCNKLLSSHDTQFFASSNDSEAVDYNKQVDVMREISKQVVIHLVFDQEKSFLTSSKPHKKKMSDDVDMEEEIRQAPHLEKFKSVVLPFVNLKGEQAPQRSWVFQKRLRLFKELDRILLGIRQCDNIWLLEDFLLKRVRNQQDVKRLVEHNRRSQGASLFSSVKQSIEEQEDMEGNETFGSQALESLYQTLSEELDDFIVQSNNHETFQAMVEEQRQHLFEICKDVVDEALETKSDLTTDLLNRFFAILRSKTALAVKEQLLTETFEEMYEDEVDFSERLPPEEVILQMLRAKVGEFEALIDVLQERVLEYFSTKKPEESKEDVEMEENKDETEKLHTKLEQSTHPMVAGGPDPDPMDLEEEPVSSVHSKSIPDPTEDVEMTDEALKLSGSSVTKEEHPTTQQQVSASPKKKVSVTLQKQGVPFDLQTHKDKVPGLAAETDNFMKQDIEELVRENNGQDIEIEFYHEERKLPLTTSLFEISSATRKPGLADPLSGDFVGFLASLADSGSPFGDAITIHFCIKDRPKPQTLRKESLSEFASIRQRTKSEAVEDISPASLNEIVQQLLEKEFQVFENSPKASATWLPAEASLKVLKVLHFVHRNVDFLTQKGIKLLTLKQCAFEQEANQVFFDDFSMLATLQAEVKPSAFQHARMNQNLVRAILDPAKLLRGSISDNLKQVFANCSFLFTFETKMLYFRLVSFIAIDSILSLNFLKQYMSRKNKRAGATQAHPSHIQRIFGQPTKDADKQFTIQRQKVTINREKLLEDALGLMEKLQKRSALEVGFSNEEGTGLGPTLEFFSLLANELKAAKDAQGRSIWRSSMVDNSLFPRAVRMPENKNPQTLKEAQQLCKLFQLAGTFVAKSIMDDRLIDLPISPLMWELIFGKKMNLFSLKSLDPLLFDLFSELQLMANERQNVERQNLTDPDAKQRLLEQIKTKKGANVKDLGLYFYDPSDDQIELVKDGGNVAVTIDNMQEYIDLALHSLFSETVRMQIQAFKKGFNAVLQIETLRPFDVQDELENLICGASKSEEAEWTSLQRLQDVIKTNHGFDHKSRAFKDFLRYLTELAPSDRKQFLKFITGSPRLPVGGFGALSPPLTVVKKKPMRPSESADEILPSVMTCQNYLKMPDYSSFEVLKSRFDLAVKEGADNFTLS